MYKCFHCKKELLWQNDFDTEDTYPDSEHQIVSMYQCNNKKCEAWYEVYTYKKENE